MRSCLLDKPERSLLPLPPKPLLRAPSAPNSAAAGGSASGGLAPVAPSIGAVSVIRNQGSGGAGTQLGLGRQGSGAGAQQPLGGQGSDARAQWGAGSRSGVGLQSGGAAGSQLGSCSEPALPNWLFTTGPPCTSAPAHLAPPAGPSSGPAPPLPDTSQSPSKLSLGSQSTPLTPRSTHSGSMTLAGPCMGDTVTQAVSGSMVAGAVAGGTVTQALPVGKALALPWTAASQPFGGALSSQAPGAWQPQLFGVGMVPGQALGTSQALLDKTITVKVCL